MSGTFLTGETKIRPGAYFNIQTNDTRTVARDSGTVAVPFRAEYGPLMAPKEYVNVSGFLKDYVGGGTTDAVSQAFSGGANKVIAVRIGSGGSTSSVKLTKDTSTDAVTITYKYPGLQEPGFSVTVRDSLSDEDSRECIIYSGTKEFEKIAFAKGDDEVAAIVAAFSNSSYFTVTAEEGQSGLLDDATQKAFTAGTAVTADTDAYGDALEALLAYDFDVIAVDTEDTAVHQLVAAYLDRIYDLGIMSMAVVAEKHTVALADRISHAAAFNDEKMCYVLNAWVTEGSQELDGYQTAARVAGMIAGTESNVSLTHTIMEGIGQLRERLTVTQINEAETKGCIVLAYSRAQEVWIDYGINTLITPKENQDDGWKKIRRTKTRYELIRRVTTDIENLIGKVDNDTNGRATVQAHIESIGMEMIAEGKLVSLTVSENADQTAEGDSAHYDIDFVDKDSLEHVYMTFYTTFSTQG